MARLVIEGPNTISGELTVQGAKNSVLPILAATLLCETQSVIHNCPALSDVETAARILESLGAFVTRDNGTVAVDAASVGSYAIPDKLMREMRSSIMFLGAIISRCGRASVSLPGGCELGPRPIDLHLRALEQLGVTIRNEHGYIECCADRGLTGANIMLAFPSVGATENIMLAACRAKGNTVIFNAAMEPEIVDLADFLIACGARIYHAGEATIYIEGVDKLYGCEHSIIPDRIAAATYLTAAAMTKGSIYVKGIKERPINAVLESLKEAGCRIAASHDGVYLECKTRPERIKRVRTQPFPGFPTDAQAIIMAMTSISNGTSMFIENIFDNRYKHAFELCRMGARINVEGRVAIVEGVESLYGASVEACDLRGGAAMVLAGIAAYGTTEITSIGHIDRGYENIEGIFSSLGARIKRILD